MTAKEDNRLPDDPPTATEIESLPNHLRPKLAEVNDIEEPHAAWVAAQVLHAEAKGESKQTQETLRRYRDYLKRKANAGA